MIITDIIMITETDTSQITVRLHQGQIITITESFQGSKETEISDKADFHQVQDKQYIQEVQCQQEVEQQHQMEDSVAEDKDIFTKRKNIWDNLNWGYPIFMSIS